MRLGAYDGELRDWLHELKFARWRPAGRTLGRWMGERLAEVGIGPGAVIVPVPTTARRLLERGIDHAGALAAAASAACGAPVVRALRRRHGASQRSVPASSRAANVRNMFSISTLAAQRGLLRDRSVVLMDDIVTTGATVRAASRALVRARPERLVVAAVAVAERSGRRRDTSGVEAEQNVDNAGKIRGSGGNFGGSEPDRLTPAG